SKTTVKGFIKRMSRWSTIRWRLNPLAYPGEILLNPMGAGLLCALSGFPAGWCLTWAISLTLFRDLVALALLRPDKNLFVAVLLGPLKDFLCVGIWLTAPFTRHVRWRNKQVRVSAGSRLYAGAPPSGER
ncbi:MAG: hypothetical protein KC561_07615, partial [Myxococcales bacterium]|nr:hypothetical protein [Myxococcales bacterium]